MNVNQLKRYGSIPTHTTPIQRYANCPVCGERFHVARFGRGNALAASAKVRGLVMAHIREKHEDREPTS